MAIIWEGDDPAHDEQITYRQLHERVIAEDDFSNLGDTSTLAEPAVVDDLINNRQNHPD